MRRTHPHLVAPLLALALLAGCGPLVQVGGNDKPPPSLLTLHASTPPLAYAAPNPATSTRTLLVTTPSTPGALQTLRLPVTVHDTELQYLSGASWSEHPAKLFRRLLADTLTAHGQTIIDPRAPAPAAARTLSGVLVEFGLDVRDAAHPVARVRYDAMLSGLGGTNPQVRRFETTVPVSGQTPAVVARALNEGSNTLAAQVAEWVGQ